MVTAGRGHGRKRSVRRAPAHVTNQNSEATQRLSRVGSEELPHSHPDAWRSLTTHTLAYTHAPANPELSFDVLWIFD